MSHQTWEYLIHLPGEAGGCGWGKDAICLSLLPLWLHLVKKHLVRKHLVREHLVTGQNLRHKEATEHQLLGASLGQV